jgi:hypothetical protein
VSERDGFEPTDRRVRALVEKLGYSINSMSGYAGDFYTTHRYRDLMIVVTELIEETTPRCGQSGYHCMSALCGRCAEIGAQ